MSKITQTTAQMIIDEYVAGLSTYRLQEKYGLWNTTIGNIIRGKCWKTCKRPENIREIIDERARHSQFQHNHNSEIHKTYPQLTELQQSIIVGSLLGDGCVRKSKHLNTRFDKKQGKKQKEYVVWHYEQLKPYSRPIREILSNDQMLWNNETKSIEHYKTTKRLTGYGLTTCSHPIFTEFRNKWYPNGTKTIPHDLELNSLIVAIWFCDDGYNNFSNREAVIATQSFTMTETEHLCDLLSGFDIHPKIMVRVSHKTGIQQPILKMNSTSYDNLINLIKPHVIWDCMQYKIRWRPAKQQWQYSGKFNPEQIAQIRELRKEIPAKEIAKRFGVHVNTIYAIVSGRSWKQVS